MERLVESRHSNFQNFWLMPVKLAWGLFSEKMCRIKRAEPWNQIPAFSEKCPNVHGVTVRLIVGSDSVFGASATEVGLTPCLG